MSHKTTRISGYKQILVNPKSRCLIPDDSIKLQNFASEIAHSITQKQKYIHPKFLYNDKGSGKSTIAFKTSLAIVLFPEPDSPASTNTSPFFYRKRYTIYCSYHRSF